MKKACSVIMCLILVLTMQFAVFAENVNLSTIVPDSHEITITFNEGGYVLHSGRRMTSGDKIIVNRFDGVTLDIIAKPDAHLESVFVNGEDVTAQVVNGQLKLENVVTDVDINFVFIDCNDPSVTDDPCARMSLKGKVYKGEDVMPSAKLEFDFGEFEAKADKKGAYKLDEIKDGRHTVSIYDKDENLAGEQAFVISVSDTATEVSVVTLDDGIRIVTVPKDTSELWLNFVVNADGSVDKITVSDWLKNHSSSDTLEDFSNLEEPTPTPTPDPEPTPKPDKNKGDIIKDHPIISKTGALIKENLVATFVLALDGLFILFFILWRKKRKDKEDEGAKVN